MTQFCAWLTVHGSTCVEFFGALLGIITVYLSARENIWNWPTALVNAALYVVVFYRTHLYSDLGLNAFYFVLSLYGWYEWLYGGAGKTELHVTRTPARTWLVVTVLAIPAWIGLGLITSRLPNASLPYADAALTTISLAAQYLATRKLLENWVLWIVADVFYVGMFIYKGLNLTAFNYAVYLVLAVMGHLAWKRSLDRTVLEHGPVAA